MPAIDAPTLYALVRHLERQSDDLRAQAQGLAGVVDPRVWNSPSSRLFVDRVREEATRLAGVATGLADAAHTLRRHVDTALRHEAELAATARAAAHTAAAVADTVAGSVLGAFR